MGKLSVMCLVLAVLVVAYLVLDSRGPDLKDYEHLLSPELRSLADEAMVVVRAQGDPTSTSKPAFALLFKTYYKLPGMKMKYGGGDAPRARWSVPGDLDPSQWAQVPRADWIGRFALPVPESVTRLPEAAGDSTLAVSLETWHYGTVAEILHVGSYATEKPTIERLHQFIREQGYRIDGPHEEEYVKGPGMFLAGNPEKYLTIIRYPVKKNGEVH